MHRRPTRRRPIPRERRRELEEPLREAKHAPKGCDQRPSEGPRRGALLHQRAGSGRHHRPDVRVLVIDSLQERREDAVSRFRARRGAREERPERALRTSGVALLEELDCALDVSIHGLGIVAGQGRGNV